MLAPELVIGLGRFAHDARVWCPFYYCAFGAVAEIQWTQHCVRELAQDLLLDGTLKLAGLDPLPSEKGPCARLELPPPALQI
jgi:hypothetical protein